MASILGKHLLLALLLAGSASPVLAGWVEISSSPQSVVYLDPAASKRVGDNVVILLLRDHTSPRIGEGGRYLSSKDEMEVDCRNRRIRRIYSSDHPQHMGEGQFVHSEHGPMSWNAAAPNTIVKRIVDVVCLQR